MTPKSPSGRPRAVLLDAGGTLFHLVRPVGEIYAETARRYGRPADGAEIHRRYLAAFGSRSAAWEEELASATPEMERAWWRDLVAEVFRPEGPFDGFERFFDELHAMFGRPDMWRLYPEVTGCLDRLRKEGLRAVVVSNWDSRLERLCQDLGVAARVERILGSARAGVSKPNPRIFHMALETLGVSAAEAVHVGDSWKDDVCGAKGCGIGAIWLKRGDSGGGATGESDPRVPDDVPVVGNLADAVDRVLS